ncbi:MAG: hypothetical protein QOE83_1981 [Actinomycetota bacterium]|jgi:hypothetical protein|nr:hypothetical protein [Actinomycetota bacterium]
MLSLGVGGRYKIQHPETLQEAYGVHIKGGSAYHRFRSRTSPDVLLPEDLAPTIALSGRASYKAFVSLDLGTPIRIDLPQVPLERASLRVVTNVAETISELCSLTGFGVSLASKTLHAKRPALIPVMDRRAFFGAYLHPAWAPGEEPYWASPLEDVVSIEQALLAVRDDLQRAENGTSWLRLKRPGESRVVAFDKVWWMFAWPSQRRVVGLDAP